jgi:hypothetical protein
MFTYCLASYALIDLRRTRRTVDFHKSEKGVFCHSFFHYTKGIHRRFLKTRSFFFRVNNHCAFLFEEKRTVDKRTIGLVRRKNEKPEALFLTGKKEKQLLVIGVFENKGCKRNGPFRTPHVFH